MAVEVQQRVMEDRDTLQKLTLYHSVDIWIGGVGTALNIALIFVFLSKRTFFRQNMMLTILAFGDLFGCLGTLLLGIFRRRLYASVISTKTVPFMTTGDCASKWFVWLRLLGSVIPSAAVLFIGLERLIAVWWPIFYRSHYSRRKGIPCGVVIIYSALVAVMALILSIWRRDSPTHYYCGRKAAFSNGFSSYVYTSAITGYIAGLLMNLITLITVGNMYAHRKNITEVNRQLRILRYLLLISLISTIAVIIPNLFSLFTVFYGRMNISVSESGSWLSAIKSSVNFFIYLSLKTDFRNRVLEIVGVPTKEAASDWDTPAPQNRSSLRDTPLIPGSSNITTT